MSRAEDVFGPVGWEPEEEEAPNGKGNGHDTHSHGKQPIIPIESVSFTGEEILALLERPELDPIQPGVPPPGHLTLLIAPSFSGKTSLALWVAMAHAAGVHPWKPGEELPRGRALLYSIDEPIEQIARRFSAFTRTHPGGRMKSNYIDNLTLVGPDREIDGDLSSLRFTQEGLDTLEAYIFAALEEGRPYSLVIVDAYADFLPMGEKESNEEATRIGGALEELAVRTNTAIELLHHSGVWQQRSEEPVDPRLMGRGASALAAKARAIFTCEEVKGLPHVRNIRTRTNLTATPRDLLLEVCDPKAHESWRIDGFSLHDPATAYNPVDLLEEDVWISTTELARALAKTPEGEKPKSAARELAGELRELWRKAGLVEVREGGRRNATELRRIPLPSQPSGSSPPKPSGN